MQIDKHPYTIAWLRRAISSTELFIAPEFWAPVVNVPEVAGYDPLDSRNNHYAGISGHLELGVLF